MPQESLDHAGDVYASLEFPAAPAERPYCFINMVCTIDGKIVSGSREEHVLDLGSKTDHVLMARIERAADAVIIGAHTLRVNPPAWRPRSRLRIVVTNSGDLPYDVPFFDSPGAFVATTQDAEFAPPSDVQVLKCGKERVDLAGVFLRMRTELGIERALVLGGAELNAQLISADLVDELVLTMAPKVKLGRDTPTYADGDPLPRERMQSYAIMEHHVIGDEVFIRYRRRR